MAAPLSELSQVISRINLQIDEKIKDLLEQCNSTAPDSIRMRLREEIVNSPQFYEMALMMVVDNQLWQNQINSLGQKLPLYKPSTVVRKAKLGHPADKLVNYTNYWTGGFYNKGIAIVADREMNQINFIIKPPYDRFIPDEVAGLTEENYNIFQDAVNEELEKRISEWFREQLKEITIDV